MTKWWGWREESQMTTRTFILGSLGNVVCRPPRQEMEEPVCKTGSGRLPEGSTGQQYYVPSSSSGGIPSPLSDGT